MKKYIKQNDTLSKVDSKVKIFPQLSCVPNNLTNEIVIVKNDGVYEANGSTKTQLVRSSGSSGGNWTLGEIRMFYGDIIPNGWLELNGGQFDSTLYPDLYSFLGTDYLPDYRECVLRGGSTPGVFSDDQMKTHTHTFSGGCHCHSNGNGASHRHTLSSMTYYCPTYLCCKIYYAYYDNCYEALTASTVHRVCSTGGLLGNTTPSCAGKSNITVVESSSAIAGNVNRDRSAGIRYIIRAEV